MASKRLKVLSLVCLLLVILGGILFFASAEFYDGAEFTGTYCGDCHVIQASVDSWVDSSHREIECGLCHGSAFTFDLSVHATHWRRLTRQIVGDFPDRIQLKDEHLDKVVGACKECHQAEYASWQAGGHSMRYSDVYLNEEQNRRMQLNNDCLRCHGMFYEGEISNLVEPISVEGPWRLIPPGIEDRPAIPCLACHQIHREGEPSKNPDYSSPETIAHQRDVSMFTLAFYDRRESMYFAVDLLPLPGMEDGDQPVRLSPDPRQRLCYQCHAPEADHKVGTGDDRTCVGVHEGISCLVCHSPHSLDSKASCKTCHPKMSNCGLDVENMDTSFKDAESAHNIHTVRCIDCHEKGVPGVQPPADS